MHLSIHKTPMFDPKQLPSSAMAASADASTTRSSRLATFFHAVVDGKRVISSAREGQLFIDAICERPDRKDCVERLVASKSAADALRIGVRFDTSIKFINGHLERFLAYLGDPLLKQLCSGEILRRLLLLIIDPPILWNDFVGAQKEGQLTPESEHAFAWLLLELLSWTSSPPVDVLPIAEEIVSREALTKSSNHEVRALIYRVKQAVNARRHDLFITDCTHDGPGGRHDNDFVDFREIAIYPTEDELESKDKPYYQRADAIDETPSDQRVAMLLDNQFRLLREDMLAELRDDLKASRDKKGRRKNMRLRGIKLAGLYVGTSKWSTPFCLTVTCEAGLEKLAEMKVVKRKSFLDKEKRFLKNNTFGCLMESNRVVAFATLERVEEKLLADPPQVTLRIPESRALEAVLAKLKDRKSEVNFVVVDTAMFAYEPFLERLKRQVELPLAQEIVGVDGDGRGRVIESAICPSTTADSIEESNGRDLQDFLDLPNEVNLDPSQLESFISGLRQTVSLIQGPPGTGKSFIGALIAKAFQKYTCHKIHVICCTNHALDQFLEDMMNVGIPHDIMVRLGSKSSSRTEHVNLHHVAQNNQARRSKATWALIGKLREEVEDYEDMLRRLLASFIHATVGIDELFNFLEFEDEDFFQAFQVPEEDDGFTRMGGQGDIVTKDYLYERWRRNLNPGVYKDRITHSAIWNLAAGDRESKIEQWTRRIMQEQLTAIIQAVNSYNASQSQLKKTLDEQKAAILRSKRIIACTTTGAAMYTELLQNASPDIILVEEAGEILESHVLTAMTPATKHLILIGDHKQLRPKVSNFALTVERGDGYDLNRSLFERLILAGFPHTTLTSQHRMHPEISKLVRHLTYPNLRDALRTSDRLPLRGIQDRVIFLNHTHLEDSEKRTGERRGEGSSVSKKNEYEADMVLQIVRYLGQQGYGTGKQVVLTPYLDQLALLRDKLSQENDPVLNDLDSFDLVKAGLIARETAAHSRRKIKLSTIDNYQGEESDVVIVSMTRANSNGDIEFMKSPERVNVLLSRARDGLVIIGNSKTFLRSKQGKETWGPLLDFMSKKGHIYEGLPVKCEQHPDKKMVLKNKRDFAILWPDGGCEQPCGAKLSCGVHECQKLCHQISDHLKMDCKKMMSDTCPQKHRLTWRCHNGRPTTCKQCDFEAEEMERKIERDFELDLKRQEQQKRYALQLMELQDAIDLQRRLCREQAEEAERQKVLQQHREDLENLKRAGVQAAPNGQTQHMNASLTHTSSPPPAAASAPGNEVPSQQTPSEQMPGSFPTATPVQKAATTPQDGNDKRRDSQQDQSRGKGEWQMTRSAAKDEWEYQKQYERASDRALDQLMDMIGLENLKEEFLTIKTKIDTAVRQGVAMNKERFGTALLGNPGTGKTTVARIYAKFLYSVGALPGDYFVESSGSDLANDGVSGCKKKLEDILNNGGGALFIDEAYQLASGSSAGGKNVLDFLLAGVENLTGKVVFILAGYNKQMEAFFAHNPGIPSRFPRQLQFRDYKNEELLEILIYRINKGWNGKMQVELGVRGLYGRIVARRIGRGRDRQGFGNARQVENVLAQIAERQAKRLLRERRAGQVPDDLLLTKEDMLGPEPADVLKDNDSWSKLQELIGLGSVKDSVKALFDSIQYNYTRELDEEPLIDFSLNKVFLGNPGTGKTTVAKLYGQILADIGFLSSGEVVVKTPADFVGSVLGGSEANTKGILAATQGKVLVIDEAYGLYGGKDKGSSDSFKTAVIDTIVAEVQSVPGDDRCFQNVNPGLTRRFPLDSAFSFDDFSDDELAAILALKLKLQGFKATDTAKKVALDMLSRARNRPHFGNAGQIDILLNDARMRHQKRISKGKGMIAATFEAEDFDPDFDRGERANTNVLELFEGAVGCAGVIAQLQGYQRTVANMRELEMDPREQIPFAFLFRGPPGTGKTSTARCMGKVYYDMGFLSTAEVKEVSATELIGQYIGHTGPKVQALFTNALGKVLFIDEAYRLGEGQFAKEAIDEIVDCLTKPQFAQKLVVILAGYTQDINRLMAVNPGLTSRFPETVCFESMTPEESLELLTQCLKKKKGLDLSILDPPDDAFRSQLVQLFTTLRGLPNWASARDVQTIGKAVYGNIMKSGKPSKQARRVTEADMVAEMEKMVKERISRGQQAHAAHAPQQQQPTISLDRSSGPPPAIDTSTTAAVESGKGETRSEDPPGDEAPTDTTASDKRDAGISDAVWNQLQEDRRKAEAAEREYHVTAEKERELEKQHEAANKESEEAELERQRRKEAKERKALQQMGVCCMGYQWIKQAGGYRCAGGSHYVSDAQIQAHLH
ncbi:P-loop containing nucleoside triphosphate hydrolase protein [Phyllosticta citrichinensis]|uniref:P-loop containing nucleoside triphosphate hydrolase protein n=1 Tax=Phyllosticta citrichinensis TaxID=1130410 RepID=A0ABR1Y6A7_9PEZI